MKILASALICLLSAGDSALAQQTLAAANAETAPTKVTPPLPAVASTTPGTLLDGTAVKLRLAENLTSATAKPGQQVSFEVVEEVDVDGVVVVPKGAKALATVTDAYAKKNMGRGGKLDVNVDSVRLADGEKVQLRAVQDAKGGGHTGAMTGAMVATAIVFFPAAPLFLFMHGKDITIPEGTPVTAFVQGDTRLDMAKLRGTGAPGTNGAAGVAVAQVASLSVESNVPGADIEVDGAFVGNTPSTVSVTPGPHTIAVKKKGYGDWSRSMNVAGSGVRVSADLEGKP